LNVGNTQEPITLPEQLHSAKAIAKNSFWLLAEKIFRFLLSFFVGVWFARYLGPENYGKYAFAYSFVTLFSVLSTLGISRIILKDLRGECSSNDTTILGSSLTLRIAGGIALIFCTLIVIHFFGSGDEAIVYMVVVFSTSYLIQSFSVIEVWFQSQLKSRKIVNAKSIGLVFSTLLKVGLILVESPVIYFAYCSVLEATLAMALLVVAYRSSGINIVSWSWNKTYCVGLLSQSWPLAFSTLSGIIYVQCDKLMLGEMASMAEVGIYAVYLQLFLIPRFVFSSLNSSYAPVLINLYEKKTSTFFAQLVKMLSINIWLAIWSIVILCLVGNNLIELLFGDEYVASEEILYWLAASFLLQVPSGLRIDYAVLKGATRILFYLRLVSALINISLNFMLIPILGILGAVISTFFTRLFFDFLINFVVPALRPYSRAYITACIDALAQKPLRLLISGELMQTEGFNIKNG